MEIIRRDELQELLDVVRMKPYGKILITGAAGSGKTFCYGTVEADRVTAGIMVTNSYFSKDARRFQQTIKSRMNLMDYSELMKQIMDCR